uniref:Uncharacterized protein n=1 Tax=Paulinella micropora TaxID=1928728 RepID=A0A385HZE9_9EUKA|nr:hypothetical protein PMNZ_077 [Paulinella micropora]AXY63040.1 hypothetical protein PMNZ_077 [Paulinella micropora]
MSDISPASRQCCPVCQVEIEHTIDNQYLVHFSRGNTGSLAKLWARVCQYLKTDDQCNQCLNQNPLLHGEISDTDYYNDIAPIEFPDK